MAQGTANKEALFNEVKGSLFEYLVGRELASRGGFEGDFIKSIDRNYLNVLSQQDRMIRQFYPEMFPFLKEASKLAAEAFTKHFGGLPTALQVVGKFSNSDLKDQLHEADLVAEFSSKKVPVSLKLNKKNAFVNTKSGGIRSFFTQYFSFLSPSVQDAFNTFADLEFSRMAYELHALHDLEYAGNFNQWVMSGHSELPGELGPESRQILKSFYARISRQMHEIFLEALANYPGKFRSSLPSLMGFSSPDIVQLILFHDFPESSSYNIQIHSAQDASLALSGVELIPHAGTSSCEFLLGNWALQIRVKPMNKFTTRAMKINCSVKVRQSSIS